MSKNILLIRLSSLGDLILSTAALAPLQEAGFSISLVTKAEFLPVLQGHPHIKEIFAMDKSLGETKNKENLFKWLAAREFAFALDLQNSWRTWSWRGQLRKLAPIYVLPKARWREWLILFLRMGRWVGLGRGGRAKRFREFTQRALQKEGFTINSHSPLTSLYVSEAEKLAVSKLLPKGDFLVLLPAGAWKSKEWPYFSDLARAAARQVPVVVLGGAKDSICESVAEAARELHPESLSLHGRTSLRESLAVIAQARWVVGNDTGMVHAAEALGKATAMIEGPTHPYLGFSLYKKESLVLGKSLLCRPCSKSGRICWRGGTRACLNGLGVSEVAESLRAKGFPC